MLDFLVPIFPFIFPIVWFGGGIILFFRFRATQRAYLRQFPPMEPHVTLDMYTSLYSAPRGAWRRINDVMMERQDDPELEALRRNMWRRYGFVALWIFGFPVLVVCIAALLIVNGLVHPH